MSHQINNFIIKNLFQSHTISNKYWFPFFTKMFRNDFCDTKTGKVVFISHLKRISHHKQKVKGFRASCMTNYVFLEYGNKIILYKPS